MHCVTSALTLIVLIIMKTAIILTNKCFNKTLTNFNKS